MQWPPTRPGVKGRKFHLVDGGGEHLVGVEAELVEDDRQFVHQRDVEVALRVLDDLGRLGHLNGCRLVRAGRDDAGSRADRWLQRPPASSRSSPW